VRGRLFLVVAFTVVLIAVTATAVVRSGSGRTTAGPLVVSGGIPPDAPAAGPAPVADVRKVKNKRRGD
jgi:hypothetical protein